MKFSISCLILTCAMSFNAFAAQLELVKYKLGDGTEKILAEGKITSLEIDSLSSQPYLIVKSSTTSGPRKVAAYIQCKISENAARTVLNLSLKDLLIVLHQDMASESQTSNTRLRLKCYNGTINNLLNTNYLEVLQLTPQKIDLLVHSSQSHLNPINMNINYELVNELSK